MLKPLSREQRNGGIFAALRHRGFRLYWSGSLLSTAGTQMQVAAVAWQVYLLTHSAIALGLVGLSRVAPIVLFSLGGGVFADALDRRRLLLVTQSVLLSLSATLAVLTFSGVITVWMIYVLTGIAAAAVAFDNPARQALVPALVSRKHLANAISLNSTMFQVATVLGPSLAGVVIATSGVGAVYLIDAFSYTSVLVALILIHPPPVIGAIQRVSVAAALDGLRFMRRSPILMWTMLLDFVATFFGSAMALLPIFARDILHVGAQGYGALYAAPSAGAILAGVLMSFYAGRIRKQGLTILISVSAYGAFTVLFGVSHVFVISMLMLAGTGAADTVSMVLRQTVRQTVTPDALRGRMTSVSMVFFMGGPQLGEFEAGMVARAFGAPFSVVIGGVGALIATAFIAYQAVTLRHYGDEPA
ncbi:MAG: MFS transporter [Chloroflexota bacterium]